MEKNENYSPLLDHDSEGNAAASLKKSLQFKDDSKLYKGYKDLNEWMMNIGKLQKQNNVKHSVRRHF